MNGIKIIKKTEIKEPPCWLAVLGSIFGIFSIIYVGLVFEVSASSRVPSPESTKTVSIPALYPDAISVYTLSPTMRVSSFEYPYLQIARRSISGFGLPINLGIFPVARLIISANDPQSGT